MAMKQFLATITAVAVAMPALAQDTNAPDVVVVDCTLEENAQLEECLVIPPVPGDVTAFLPGALPLIGVGVAALLGGGGGGTPTTPTTPSTN